jgi:hypothetical protein
MRVGVLKPGVDASINRVTPSQWGHAAKMAQLVAGFMALAALGASIVIGAEPSTCLLRGVGAYVAGLLAGSLWTAIFGPVEPPKQKGGKKAEAPDPQPEQNLEAA